MSDATQANPPPPSKRWSLLRATPEFLNYDFCPWANRYVYWLKQPIGWFVIGAAASLLIAVFLSPHAWIIFGALVVVMLMGVVWPWVAVCGITAEIIFDCRRRREGELIEARLLVRNAWPWPLWGLAVEKGFHNQSGDSEARPVTALACVPGWSRSEFVFEFRPSQRGVYPREVPELATGFPFGIWRAHRAIPVERELIVWPRTTALTSIPSIGGDVPDVIGMLFDRPGTEGDMIGVRPYRRGDRLRSIHWAQTARRDMFIVTERQAAARRLIVVACDVSAFFGAEDNATVEPAIRVAASIAREFHAHHAQVRFVIGHVDLLLEPGTPGLHRLLDALARYEPSDQPTSLPLDSQRDALTLVITSERRRGAFAAAVGPGSQLRFVLVDRDSPSPWPRSAGRDRAWMQVDPSADESQQLRRQWERVCHDNIAN